MRGGCGSGADHDDDNDGHEDDDDSGGADNNEDEDVESKGNDVSTVAAATQFLEGG